MTNRPSIDRCRALRLLGALAGVSIALGACTTDGGEIVTASATPLPKSVFSVPEGTK